MSPLLIGALILLVYAPLLWVRFTLWRFRQDLADIPGTGAELARHLVRKFELTEVVIEEGQSGQDHYSPTEKTVRLGPENYNGKSLTAVAIAAHEVGHAIQFHRNEPTCQLYSKYYPVAHRIQRLGIAMVSLPVFGLLLSSPRISIVAMMLVAGVMIISAFVHLIILPQEWDASFNKAMPILEQGDYIDSKHLPAIRAILRAAALTYFAAALADVLRCWRWGGLLRGLRF
ncbi:MAG: Zn-dependent membrane protease YugP [Candidatus Azotimanducaceae bacterium]